MSAPRMHADELPVDDALVRRLVVEQFPRWAGLPLEPVHPSGTDNALYRLGSDLVVRLPRRDRTVKTLAKELRWLPKLAPLLPIAVPLPVASGDPAAFFPYPWAVYRWLPGEDVTTGAIADLPRLAIDLARFLTALQAIDPSDGPLPGDHNFRRGEPLAARDTQTRAAIEHLRGALDADLLAQAWERALRVREWQGPGVWIHGDLDARNLLVEAGRLSGVIDFGGLAVGDPACDVMVAWKVLSPGSREVFRIALAVDEATWARARGWALSQAVGALSYYTDETNAILVDQARGWLAAVLADSR